MPLTIFLYVHKIRKEGKNDRIVLHFNVSTKASKTTPTQRLIIFLKIEKIKKFAPILNIKARKSRLVSPHEL